MQFLGKNKSEYLYANFKNVLTIRWYFSYIGFSCTMLYCIRMFRVLLKVIYLPRFDFKPVNFFWVCCLLKDVSSSLFQSLRKPLHASCYYSVWTTVFYPRIFGMFSKIAVFFGSNLFVTQRLTVYF